MNSQLIGPHNSAARCAPCVRCARAALTLFPAVVQ